MTLALRAVYQLSQSVELQPSPGGAVKFVLTVGSRDEFDCAKCSDAKRIERGYCPFVKGAQRATVPHNLGDVDKEEDLLYACPKGIRLRNPGVWETLRTFFVIQSSGIFDFYGEGLAYCAPRVAWTWAELCGIQEDFLATIRRVRRMMDERPPNG